MEEAMFRPCTRMHDRICAWNDNPDNDGAFDDVLCEDPVFEEVELRAGAGNGAVDVFRHPDFTVTFNDLWRLASRKIVWIGPDIFVVSPPSILFNFEPIFDVTVAGLGTGLDNELQVCSLSVTGATTAVCDCVFELMTRSNTICTHLAINVLPSVSTHALSRFLDNSLLGGGGCLFKLSQDHLREYLQVLEVSAGPDHRIELLIELNWSQLQTETLANFLQSCSCAITLECLRFPVPSLIPDALCGDGNLVDLLYIGCPISMDWYGRLPRTRVLGACPFIAHK